MMTPAEIAALLPHGEGMCLLDTVLHHDERRLVCTAAARANHPLRRDGHLPAVAALEYGAQATGLWAALTLGAREKPAEGYVVAARGLRLNVEYLPCDQMLTISVDKKLLGDDSALCRFEVAADRQTLAQGQLTLMMRKA